MAIDLRTLIEGLPSDRQLGMLELAQRISALVASTNGPAWRHNEGDYAKLCNVIMMYNKKYSFRSHNAIDGISFPDRNDDQKWENYLRVILLPEVDELRIWIEGNKAGDEAAKLFDEYDEGDQVFGYAFLTSEEKSNIHASLSAIRDIVESSELNARKKNALFRKLHALSAEVDKTGTATDQFFGFLGDLGVTAGEMAEKAKPAIDQFKDVLRIVWNRRSKDEKALPAPKDFTLLPPVS